MESTRKKESDKERLKGERERDRARELERDSIARQTHFDTAVPQKNSHHV